MQLTFALAFILTNIVEMPVAWFLLRKREGTVHILSVVLLCNVMTLPYVWFVFPAFLALPYVQLLLASELFAFALEMVIYSAAFRKAGALRATIAAIAANCASLIVGLVINSA